MKNIEQMMRELSWTGEDFCLSITYGSGSWTAVIADLQCDTVICSEKDTFNELPLQASGDTLEDVIKELDSICVRAE